MLKEKKSHKKSIILIILGSLIILLMYIGFNYLKKTNEPKTLFIETSNMIFNEVLEKLDSISINDTYLYDGKIDFNTNIEEYSLLNSEVIDYKYGMDTKDKKALANIKLTEDNKMLFDIEGNIKNNNVYFDLNDLYNKIIVIDNNFIKENIGISINELFDKINNVYNKENIDDYKYVINKFKELTNDVINEINYAKDNTKVNINGSEVALKKVSVNFNKQNVDIIINTYVDGILNDKELLNKLVKVSEVEQDELINGLKKLKNYDDSMLESNAKLEVYTMGLLNSIIKVSFVENGQTLLDYIDYRNYKLLLIDNLEIEIDNEELIVKQHKEVIAKGIVNSLDKDNIDINFEVINSDIKGSIVYQNKSDNNEIKISLDNIYEGMKINLLINDKKINDNEFSIDIKIGVIMDDKNIQINNYTKVSKNSNIDDINFNNAINYQELSEEDLENIMINIQNKLKDTKIIEFINSSNNEPDNNEMT